MICRFCPTGLATCAAAESAKPGDLDGRFIPKPSRFSAECPPLLHPMNWSGKDVERSRYAESMSGEVAVGIMADL
jgi:hypothetical protein